MLIHHCYPFKTYSRPTESETQAAQSGQAIDSGLGQAQDVLVIAGGALWIWNAVQDRFPQARCRLDLCHGHEHLWTVANEPYGKGTPEARQWVQPLLGQLHQDDTGAVIRSLKDIEATVREKLREKVQAQITYFENNQNRINYRQILHARDAVKKGRATSVQQIKACEPLGSGAIDHHLFPSDARRQIRELKAVAFHFGQRRCLWRKSKVPLPLIVCGPTKVSISQRSPRPSWAA